MQPQYPTADTIIRLEQEARALRAAYITRSLAAIYRRITGRRTTGGSFPQQPAQA
jgi:hypothetical protein